ncbi:MAG: class I SAM-dependent methyltransferase [Planctomycetota bacterium]
MSQVAPPPHQPVAIEKTPDAPELPSADMPPASTPLAFPERRIDYVREESFHDEWGQAIDPAHVPVVESFEACTAPENRFIMNWLGDVRGRRVLDLGCGAGEAAVYFAMQGAEVTATDISTGMLRLTRRVARRYGVKVRCVRQNGDDLNFPRQSFDVVYAGNLLHHVNMERCLATVAQVLKPDGRFVSWDPLRHNPIINIYRKMASAVRTDDETPLHINDTSKFRRYFAQVEQQSFWLSGLWIFMRFFLIERVHPSKERYWKKIIVEAERLRSLYLRFEHLDETLLRWFPYLRRMCWNMVVCAARPRVASNLETENTKASLQRVVAKTRRTAAQLTPKQPALRE